MPLNCSLFFNPLEECGFVAAVTSDSFSALFFIFPPAANFFAIAALLLERCQEKVRGDFPSLFPQWCFKPHFKVYQKHTTIQTQPNLRFVATERQFMHVLGLWEEENQCRLMETMQTPP